MIVRFQPGQGQPVPPRHTPPLAGTGPQTGLRSDQQCSSARAAGRHPQLRWPRSKAQQEWRARIKTSKRETRLEPHVL